MLVNIAINLLWIALGIIILGAVVYLLLRVIGLWWPLPDRIVQAVWLVFGILCLIGILSSLSGGGGARPFRFGELDQRPAAIERAA